MSLSNADRPYLKCNGSVCIMSWMEMWGIAWSHPTMDTVRTACPLDGSFVLCLLLPHRQRQEQ